jgi:hypothetical protein
LTGTTHSAIVRKLARYDRITRSYIVIDVQINFLFEQLDASFEETIPLWRNELLDSDPTINWADSITATTSATELAEQDEHEELQRLERSLHDPSS